MTDTSHFSGEEDKHEYRVGFLVEKDMVSADLGCRQVCSRQFSHRLRAAPFHVTIIQVNASTSGHAIAIVLYVLLILLFIHKLPRGLKGEKKALSIIGRSLEKKDCLKWFWLIGCKCHIRDIIKSLYDNGCSENC